MFTLEDLLFKCSHDNKTENISKGREIKGYFLSLKDFILGNYRKIQTENYNIFLFLREKNRHSSDVKVCHSFRSRERILKFIEYKHFFPIKYINDK